ncbi:MAG: hypothetical protein FJW30_27885 [Acidobacteria bacterium]|nr:hypothetical protein [Acidobacteriota bacterium]
MDWLLLVGAGLLVYFVREVLLLAAAPVATRTKQWTVWAACQWIVFTVLGWAAESVPRNQAHALLRSPWFWEPAVAVHLVLWAIFTLLRRREQPEPALRWARLFPPPMALFAGGALVWLALTRTGYFEGWSAGLAVGTVRIAAVFLGAMVWRGRAEVDTALQFAAAANLSAVLLIPIQQSSDTQSGIAEQPIDWAATLLPLALTASLILLSFLFHRFRSSRRAA